VHCTGQIPLRYPVAEEVADLHADLHVHYVHVAGRSKASGELVCDQVRAVSMCVRNRVCDLDSVMEFGLSRAANDILP